MKAMRMFRARAYAVPKSNNLDKYAGLLAREAGVDNLAISQEGDKYVLSQGNMRLCAAYSKDEVIACITGYIAGLRTAKQA